LLPLFLLLQHALRLGQAVEHLLALGHRRIGYVEISRRELNPWRYAGYAGALEAAGLGVDNALVAPAHANLESCLRAAEALLDLPDRPTAIFAFDDQRAWAVWRVAEGRGLVIGRDLALVSCGNSAAENGFSAELSSVHLDLREIGRVALTKLQELIGGVAKPGEAVKVPPELLIRKSSRDARVVPADGK
jgi:LacI family transcriptional regulator